MPAVVSLEAVGSTKELRRWGVAAHRDTALFFGCRDLDSAYAYLRTEGIDLEKPKVAPYGMKQLWFADPDGYVICLQWPAD